MFTAGAPSSTVTASLNTSRTDSFSPSVQTPSPEGSGANAARVTYGAVAKPVAAGRSSASAIAVPFSASPSGATRAFRAPASAAGTVQAKRSVSVPDPDA